MHQSWLFQQDTKHTSKQAASVLQNNEIDIIEYIAESIKTVFLILY